MTCILEEKDGKNVGFNAHILARDLTLSLHYLPHIGPLFVE